MNKPLDNADMPAFPTSYDNRQGMSLRAYFAGKAMAAIVNAGHGSQGASLALAGLANKAGLDVHDAVAGLALNYADALINALAKTSK
jgi:hypothetical protein